jgi:LysR family hydrogen peroxide-inducible transcriptional activator
MHDLKIVPFAEPMPERRICIAWRRNRVRHDECVELAKIIRGLRSVILPQNAGEAAPGSPAG